MQCNGYYLLATEMSERKQAHNTIQHKTTQNIETT